MRPALAQCRLFGKLLDNWKSRTSGSSESDEGVDRYWWLQKSIYSLFS